MSSAALVCGAPVLTPRGGMVAYSDALRGRPAVPLNAVSACLDVFAPGGLTAQLVTRCRFGSVDEVNRMFSLPLSSGEVRLRLLFRTEGWLWETAPASPPICHERFFRVLTSVTHPIAVCCVVSPVAKPVSMWPLCHPETVLYDLVLQARTPRAGRILWHAFRLPSAPDVAVRHPQLRRNERFDGHLIPAAPA